MKNSMPPVGSFLTLTVYSSEKIPAESARDPRHAVRSYHKRVGATSIMDPVTECDIYGAAYVRFITSAEHAPDGVRSVKTVEARRCLP